MATFSVELDLGHEVGRVAPQLEPVTLLDHLVRLLLGHTTDATPVRS
jgi:hypothetical protein